MKYKVGQIVKIKPTAWSFCISRSDMGELAKIYDIKTNWNFGGKIYSVLYFITIINTHHIHTWAARETDIELPIKIGQQLVFSFMEEG